MTCIRYLRLWERFRGEFKRNRDLEMRLWDRYGDDRVDREWEFCLQKGDHDLNLRLDNNLDRENCRLDRNRDRNRDRLKNDRERDR